MKNEFFGYEKLTINVIKRNCIACNFQSYTSLALVPKEKIRLLVYAKERLAFSIIIFDSIFRAVAK